jgi:hypothetical protein
LSGSVHFPNKRGVVSGLTGGVSFVVGFFDISATPLGLGSTISLPCFVSGYRDASYLAIALFLNWI